MKEEQALQRMVSPGQVRPRKKHGGAIQIWVTRICDKACFGCTQGSNLRGNSGFITPEQFEQACTSLKGYFGTVGVFGGNPALHPQFNRLCEILRKHVPFKYRGLWCNRLMGKGKTARATFNPAASNLNVHLDEDAYDEFKRDWPESKPFGVTNDSRHSPPFVAMQDIIPDADERWTLIANCDINRHWSAMICIFRGELRAYFCEIAGAQAILHQDEPDYPDLGTPVEPDWWKKPMESFTPQVNHHCHACGVPLRSYGELAQAKEGTERVTQTHANIYVPKIKGRRVTIIHQRKQLQEQSVSKFIDYLGNAKR